MDKAISMCRMNGLFVKVLRLELAPLDACDLRAYQCGAGFEILRAIFCPYFQLSVVRGQSLEMLLSLVGRCGIAGCGAGQRAVKVIFRGFKTGWGCPKQPLRPQRGIDGRRIVPRKKARLQLAGPIRALGQCQTGLPDKWASNWSSSNWPSSKEPNFGVNPRRVRISPSWAVMRSMTRTNRILWANSRPCSVSRCTSTSGSPAASRFVFRSRRLYAANVRSPILFAASNSRRSRSRAVLTCSSRA